MARGLPLRELRLPAPELAPRLIGCRLVTDSVRARITEVEAYHGEDDRACHASRGRTPRSEVLYREALNMRLDLGDEMIRQRLILKVRDILFKNVITEAPPPDQLQAWFEENRSAYDRPELVDFEQFLVTDLDSEAAAALAARLGDAEHPQGYAAAFRRYPRRPLSNLGAAFGDDDGQRLIDGEDDQWMAVESDYGWHLARITARYAGEPADFTAVRARVAQDSLESARKQELANTLSAIVDQYDISYSLSPDIVKDSLQEAEMAARSETP